MALDPHIPLPLSEFMLGTLEVDWIGGGTSRRGSSQRLAMNLRAIMRGEQPDNLLDWSVTAWTTFRTEAIGAVDFEMAPNGGWALPKEQRLAGVTGFMTRLLKRYADGDEPTFSLAAMRLLRDSKPDDFDRIVDLVEGTEGAAYVHLVEMGYERERKDEADARHDDLVRPGDEVGDVLVTDALTPCDPKADVDAADHDAAPTPGPDEEAEDA